MTTVSPTLGLRYSTQNVLAPRAVSIARNVSASTRHVNAVPYAPRPSRVPSHAAGRPLGCVRATAAGRRGWPLAAASAVFLSTKFRAEPLVVTSRASGAYVVSGDDGAGSRR